MPGSSTGSQPQADHMGRANHSRTLLHFHAIGRGRWAFRAHLGPLTGSRWLAKTDYVSTSCQPRSPSSQLAVGRVLPFLTHQAGIGGFGHPSYRAEGPYVWKGLSSFTTTFALTSGNHTIR